MDNYLHVDMNIDLCQNCHFNVENISIYNTCDYHLLVHESMSHFTFRPTLTKIRVIRYIYN